MKNKIKTFKCHKCGTIIIIDKNTAKCENCGNEYALRDGKFYRENMWSKWRDELDKNRKNGTGKVKNINLLREIWQRKNKLKQNMEQRLSWFFLTMNLEILLII